MELDKIYFFTATIKDWIPLLDKKEYKEIVLKSLKFLHDKRLIQIYGFVIMPNHIHLIWQMLEMNGKESPHSSFLKFTAHEFLNKIRNEYPELLKLFEVDEVNKLHSFWQRDPMDTEIFTPKVIFQKLEYIHNNPCKGKWMLAENPVSYPYSSFEFYETGKDVFGFLTHVGERI